jgi:hypothetical protein
MKTTSMSKEERFKALVEKYQCPGCVAGFDTTCGLFEIHQISENCALCKRHVLGTMLVGIGNLALGLPKGFNRPGWTYPGHVEDTRSRNVMFLRIFLEESDMYWDNMNVPVWALDHEGDLLVRTMLPRIGVHYVDIIENKTLKFIPDHFNVIDVSEFKDEID